MSIRTLNTEAFQVWIADRGIGRTPKDGHPERLVFTAGGVGGRWPYPGAAARVPEFVATLLSAVRRNERYWVYPERGIWSPGRETESDHRPCATKVRLAPGSRVTVAGVTSRATSCGDGGEVESRISTVAESPIEVPDAKARTTKLPTVGPAV